MMVGFVGRLARYMLQVAIEAEATAFLGREHYRRGARQRAAWRNGYASLMAASKLWRGIPMAAAMLRQLAQLRAETMPTTKEEAVA
jgi:hypothetical protein